MATTTTTTLQTTGTKKTTILRFSDPTELVRLARQCKICMKSSDTATFRITATEISVFQFCFPTCSCLLFYETSKFDVVSRSEFRAIAKHGTGAAVADDDDPSTKSSPSSSSDDDDGQMGHCDVATAVEGTVVVSLSNDIFCKVMEHVGSAAGTAPIFWKISTESLTIVYDQRRKTSKLRLLADNRYFSNEKGTSMLLKFKKNIITRIPLDGDFLAYVRMLTQVEREPIYRLKLTKRSLRLSLYESTVGHHTYKFRIPSKTRASFDNVFPEYVFKAAMKANEVVVYPLDIDALLMTVDGLELLFSSRQTDDSTDDSVMLSKRKRC